MKPLEMALTEIIGAELRNTIVPKLNSQLCFWKRYSDDTLIIVKEGPINHVHQQLNSSHPNIQFTFETETSGRIPFLDIPISLLNQKVKELQQQLTEKVPTQAYIRFSISKVLAYEVYKICSTEYLLKNELLHLEKMFYLLE